MTLIMTLGNILKAKEYNLRIFKINLIFIIKFIKTT
jgi:hypothetical protein